MSKGGRLIEKIWVNDLEDGFYFVMFRGIRVPYVIRRGFDVWKVQYNRRERTRVKFDRDLRPDSERFEAAGMRLIGTADFAGPEGDVMDLLVDAGYFLLDGAQPKGMPFPLVSYRGWPRSEPKAMLPPVGDGTALEYGERSRHYHASLIPVEADFLPPRLLDLVNKPVSG